MIRIEIGDIHIDVNGITSKLQSDKLGKFAATEWHRLYSPFVPMDTGQLKDQVDIRPWEIEHTSPYARYIYNGRAYGPNFPIMKGKKVVGFFSQKGKPKRPNGKALRFKKGKHPRASARWDQVAQPTQGPRLARAIQRFIDRGGLDL